MDYSITVPIDTNAPGYVNFTIDTSLCYLWQYDNAENLKGILHDQEQFIKQNVTDVFEHYTEKVFSIKTADTFGLNVWGQILGVKRDYTLTKTVEEETVTSVISVSDELYRRMLIATATRHNMAGTLPEIWKYLQIILPGREFYIHDKHDMSIEIQYRFIPTDEELAILQDSSFIPLPAGVLMNGEPPPSNTLFGFCTMENYQPGEEYTGDYNVFATGNTASPGGVFLF